MNIVNKRAHFEYVITDKYKAGMVLTGSEVKSIRAGNTNLSDSYCIFTNNQLIIKNMHIGVFKQASFNNHPPLRERILLLNKTEKKKLFTKSRDKGFTIVPLSIFISDTGYIKMEVGLARGKKTFDKRESIKERDTERSMRRGDD
jgi:SsrA-binding protein